MGYALITGGGTDGRYTVEFDYGVATRDAILANLGVAQTNLNAKLVEQQAIVDECDAIELAAREDILTVQEFLTDSINANQGSADPEALNVYTKFVGEYRKLQASHFPARQALSTIKSQLAECAREVVRYNAAAVSETRRVWCCDLTEDATGYVATVDIPGETNLMLVAPGGRAWTSADGVFTAREIMSPEQAYFNVAILPGWQKWLPTYRWGTVTETNYAANTMSVDVEPATSSGGRLDVNQSTTLTDVPVTYMTCGCQAFREGDRVVIKFMGQLWDSPEVIGFVDNPKMCGNLRIGNVVINESYAPERGFSNDNGYVLKFVDPDAWSVIFNSVSSIVCSMRTNRGAWTLMYKATVGAVWTRNTPVEGGTGGWSVVVQEPGQDPENYPTGKFSLAVSTVFGAGVVGDIFEVKLELAGRVLHNIAVLLVNASGLTLLSDSGGETWIKTYGGGFGEAMTKTDKSLISGYVNDVRTLPGYVLESDE
jgi:hypothetical protein